MAFPLGSRLNRPGANITGAYYRRAELIGKRMELLHEIVPPELVHCTQRPGKRFTFATGHPARTAGWLGREWRNAQLASVIGPPSTE